jgi:hypothetical protein
MAGGFIADRIFNTLRAISAEQEQKYVYAESAASVCTRNAGHPCDRDVLRTSAGQRRFRTRSGGDGPQNATLYGDPNKPGLYIVLTKWTPHHMSRPHFHPNDRFIHVVSGTWWVGWGPKYDPDSTFAIPAGSFVQHYGKQIHYDGAKDGEAVLEIVGMGPATSTPAEQK